MLHDLITNNTMFYCTTSKSVVINVSARRNLGNGRMAFWHTVKRAHGEKVERYWRRVLSRVAM